MLAVCLFSSGMCAQFEEYICVVYVLCCACSRRWWLIKRPYLLSGPKIAGATEAKRAAHIVETANVVAFGLDQKRCARRMTVPRCRRTKVHVAALDGQAVVCAMCM